MLIYTLNTHGSNLENCVLKSQLYKCVYSVNEVSSDSHASLGVDQAG